MALVLPLLLVQPALGVAHPDLHIPTSFNDFINTTEHALLPNKGNGTVLDELSCYSLPYGGIGFAGHILTYWTLAMLVSGRRPLMPWKDLTFQRLDLFLDALSLLLSIPFAVLTIVRCLGRWEYVLLAVWKTTLAVSLSALSFHRSWTITADVRRRKLQKEQEPDGDEHEMDTVPGIAQSQPYPGGGGGYFPGPGNAGYKPVPNPSVAIKNVRERVADMGPGVKLSLLSWLVLYALGTIVGLVGLFSIVFHTLHENHTLRMVSTVFLVVAVVPTSLYIIIVLLIKVLSRKTAAEAQPGVGGKIKEGLGEMFLHGTLSLALLVIWGGMLAAFYSDWVLAAIADNLAGTPSQDNFFIYWTYYIAKRIPLFSL